MGAFSLSSLYKSKGWPFVKRSKSLRNPEGLYSKLFLKAGSLILLFIILDERLKFLAHILFYYF